MEHRICSTEYCSLFCFYAVSLQSWLQYFWRSRQLSILLYKFYIQKPILTNYYTISYIQENQLIRNNNNIIILCLSQSASRATIQLILTLLPLLEFLCRASYHFTKAHCSYHLAKKQINLFHVAFLFTRILNRMFHYDRALCLDHDGYLTSIHHYSYLHSYTYKSLLRAFCLQAIHLNNVLHCCKYKNRFPLFYYHAIHLNIHTYLQQRAHLSLIFFHLSNILYRLLSLICKYNFLSHAVCHSATLLCKYRHSSSSMFQHHFGDRDPISLNIDRHWSSYKFHCPFVHLFTINHNTQFYQYIETVPSHAFYLLSTIHHKNYRLSKLFCLNLLYYRLIAIQCKLIHSIIQSQIFEQVRDQTLTTGLFLQKNDNFHALFFHLQNTFLKNNLHFNIYTFPNRAQAHFKISLRRIILHSDRVFRFLEKLNLSIPLSI